VAAIPICQCWTFPLTRFVDANPICASSSSRSRRVHTGASQCARSSSRVGRLSGLLCQWERTSRQGATLKLHKGKARYLSLPLFPTPSLQEALTRSCPGLPGPCSPAWPNVGIGPGRQVRIGLVQVPSRDVSIRRPGSSLPARPRAQEPGMLVRITIFNERTVGAIPARPCTCRRGGAAAGVNSIPVPRAAGTGLARRRA
jgi:hypothetical protein